MHPSLKILILEDNSFDVDLALTVLTAAGYHCHWDRVVGRDDYLEHITSGDVYDIILADYSLPGFSELEALQIYQKHQIDIPFIFLSGVVGEEVAIESLQASATDYVLKNRLTRLVHLEYRMVASDGRSVWLHELVSLIRENGKVTKMRGIMFDITGRKEVKAALRTSEERSRSLLENLPIPIFTKDIAGVYTSSNLENQQLPSKQGLASYFLACRSHLGKAFCLSRAI